MTSALPATYPAILTDLAEFTSQSLSYCSEICHRSNKTYRPFFVESVKIRHFGARLDFTSEPCQLCLPTCHLAT